MDSNQTNSLVGFLFMFVLVIWAVASWGDPDLIDALIYHLSDGYYKHYVPANVDPPLPGTIGEGGSIIGRL